MTIFESPGGLFFVRVGLGRIWFDTLEEAREQVGDDARFGGMTHARLEPEDDGWDEF